MGKFFTDLATSHAAALDLAHREHLALEEVRRRMTEAFDREWLRLTDGASLLKRVGQEFEQSTGLTLEDWTPKHLPIHLPTYFITVESSDARYRQYPALMGMEFQETRHNTTYYAHVYLCLVVATWNRRENPLDLWEDDAQASLILQVKLQGGSSAREERLHLSDPVDPLHVNLDELMEALAAGVTMAREYLATACGEQQASSPEVAHKGGLIAAKLVLLDYAEARPGTLLRSPDACVEGLHKELWFPEPATTTAA